MKHVHRVVNNEYFYKFQFFKDIWKLKVFFLNIYQV